MTPSAEHQQIVVLGASGGVGRHLVDEALRRGHDVVAIVRNPDRFDHALDPHLSVVRGDVYDPSSIQAAISPNSVVVSGLGVASKKDAGTLTAGARAVLSAQPAAIIWLGAVGTGRSAKNVSWLTHRLLKAGFGPEYEDKVTADGIVFDAGHKVIHAGPMNDKDNVAYKAVPVATAPHRFFPHFVSRRAVAQIMLTEAEKQTPSASILVTQPTA